MNNDTIEYKDPFSNEADQVHFSDDIKTTDTVKTGLLKECSASVVAYHELNSVREKQFFDTGELVFPIGNTQLALDLNGHFADGPYFSAYTRLAFFGHYQIDEGGKSMGKFGHYLLEEYVSYYSVNKRFGINIGRHKPQWSNGYHWTPANLLKPVYDRPSLDSDILIQQQGWDMLHIDLRYGGWNIGLYTVEVADGAGKVSDRAFTQKGLQTALRINREGDLDTQLIFHRLKGGDTAAALGLSTLAQDRMTLRLEAAWEQQRELPVVSHFRYDHKERQGYLKMVLGTQISLNGGWEFTAEYLHNTHGYENTEWNQVRAQVDLAQMSLQSTQAQDAAEFLINSYDLLKVGQLRREYLFFMWGNTRLEKKFQYRQSIHYNMDDHSQLHSLECTQNWTEHFSTRLQAQLFTGCKRCEYGLIPNKGSSAAECQIPL
ncbi:hypothetical protein [uncultured Microbulbifer sp.]|uniref:hypothetical protein n=1 Tax=uncultured Microbulbifer sp. TaxID=348147 RepID=UPI00262395E1|nr:hypothetical protein [uncultured Microbulbifer sp.]